MVDVASFKTWSFIIGCILIDVGVYLKTDLPTAVIVAGLLCFLAGMATVSEA
jgi:hypothetical protein